MSFSFFFSFEKEELGEGVRLFFRTNLLFFDLHNSEVLSNLLFKHIYTVTTRQEKEQVFPWK